MGGVSLEPYTPVYGTDEEEVAKLEEANSDDSRFNVVEPMLMAEVNVFQFMRVGLGASYRFVDGLKADLYKN
ncbi:MAG: hypothetical protein GY888_17175 [Planctomycetaceae bacterium]|nr:hypothetical protein [Planctomycetaceae bacterium]